MHVRQAIGIAVAILCTAAPAERPGGLHRPVGAALSRGHHRADSRSRAGRLHRTSAQRGGPAARRFLGRGSHLGRAGVSVPSALVGLLAPRPRAAAHLGRLRSRDAAHRRLPYPHRRLREQADDLSRWPAAPDRVRAAHVSGILDRRVGRQHAHRHDDAPEGELPPAQRRAAQLEGDVHRALGRCTATT